MTTEVLRPNESGRNPLGADYRWFLWAPDGSGFLGGSLLDEDGPPWQIFERPVDGSADPRELGLTMVGTPQDISPDGTQILYNVGRTVSSARVRPGDGTDRLLVDTGETVFTPRFSPDGSWIVYGVIDEDRAREIYAQPFPGGVENRQLIADNGLNPQWRRDGLEIAYLGFEDGIWSVWSVRVAAVGKTLNFLPPERLFPVRLPAYFVPRMSPLAVSHDGSRFYFIQGVEQPGSEVIHVRTGWPGSS